MYKKPDEPSKKEFEYISACKEIRLKTDPAAKVLSSLVLDGYSKEEQFIHFFSDAALIEILPESAQSVIDNTAELLNKVDSRFTFAYSDFSSNNVKCYTNQVSKIISNIHKISDYDPMTIHVIRSANECLQNKDTFGLFQDMFMHDEIKMLHFIYIFDEQSYYLFCDKYNFTMNAHPIWLHRLPGSSDINQKTQDHSLERVNITSINCNIFTQSGKSLMNRAQRQADLFEESEIDYTSLLLAAAEGVESSVALEQCLNLTPERLQWLRDDAKGLWKGSRNNSFYLCDSSTEVVVRNAIKMASAEGYPDPKQPGLVSIFHLIGALSISEGVKKDFGANKSLSFEQAVNQIADWYYHKKVSPSITENSKALSEIGYKHGLYRNMLGNIFGQQEALVAINDVFSWSEFKKYDKKRYSGLFACLLFIGPEGVGKVSLARLISEVYNFSLQYYNLSFYTREQSLTVKPKSTNNHKSLLVFENIEKAHPSVINQICYLITTGNFKNQNSGEEVDCTNSIVIIITKSENDWELEKEQHKLNKLAIKQKAALESLYDANNHNNMSPLIPTNMLSLLEKEQVIIFNRLQVKDLLNICERKLVQFGTIIENSAAKRVTYHPLLPPAIIFSEGGKPRPSAISTAVEMLISTEARKFISGFAEGSALYLLSSYDRMHFSIEDEEQMNPEVAGLFQTPKKPNILVLASKETTDSFILNIEDINWFPVNSYEALELALKERYYDFVLLDIWFNIKSYKEKKKKIIQEFISGLNWDNMSLPFAAIALELFGEKYMQNIRYLSAKYPVVMLNQIDSVWGNNVQELWKRPLSYYLEVSEELSRMRDKYPLEFPAYLGVFRYDLFMEFLESYFLRGIINTKTENTENYTGMSEEYWHGLASCIDGIHQKLHRERMAEELSNSGKVLSFNPKWELNKDNNLVTIRLKDLKLVSSPVF